MTSLPYEHRVYQHGQITFILTPQKIIIQTTYQAFFLNPTPNSYGKIQSIRRYIANGQIQTLGDLGKSCGTSIAWVHTGHRFAIDNMLQLT